jgi:hypothetical protein
MGSFARVTKDIRMKDVNMDLRCEETLMIQIVELGKKGLLGVLSSGLLLICEVVDMSRTRNTYEKIFFRNIR